jgi:phage terminase small subunit
MSEGKKLTPKQRLFVDYYLQCFNASEAARRAGYSPKTARQIGQENLTKPDIQAEIQERLKEVHMSADEALKLLADMARGDVAQIMEISSVGFNLNMSKAQEKGLTRLIKKVKQKTVTHIAKSESDEDREVVDLEVELYDAQAALDKILRVAGKYKDLGSEENPLSVVVKRVGVDVEKL